jgi:uncharacterized protein (DUF1778 family)
MTATPRTTTVRLTPRERRLVEVAASRQGVGPSSYMRRAAVAAAERDVIAAAVEEPAQDGRER